MDELTDLRLQMDSLKKSLEKSQIINEELVRSVTRAKSSWINKLVIWEIIFTPILTLIIVADCYLVHVSIWFGIIAGVGMLADSLIDLKTTRLSRKDIVNLDLRSLRNKLIRQKRMRYKQFLIALPLSLIWGGAFVYCLVRNKMMEYELPQHDILICALTVCGVTVVLTLICCLVLYRKIQRTGTEIISTIDDLHAEEAEEAAETNATRD